MPITPNNPDTSDDQPDDKKPVRRTPEQKREWLKQQTALNDAVIAERAKKARDHALFTLGGAVLAMKDAALNAKLLALVGNEKSREKVAALIAAEGTR